MSNLFEHQVRVRWRDTDALGHVNHAVFVTYLEEGRDAFFARVLGSDLSYVVVRLEVDLRAEILPRRDDFAGDAWVADWVRRSGGSPSDCLPAPLRLRRESEQLAATVAELRSEQEVRDRVTELNDRIKAHRRIPEGPPVFVPLVEEETMLDRWRAAHQAPVPGPPPTAQVPARRRRWWRR